MNRRSLIIPLVYLSVLVAPEPAPAVPPPAFLPADLARLDQQQNVAVGAGGWLFLRLPAAAANAMIGKDDPAVYLYHVDSGNPEQQLDCEPIGAPLFQNTRPVRCHIADLAAVHSAQRYAVVAGTLPLWAGTVYTDQRPPVLQVQVAEQSNCTLVTIRYNDPESTLPSQRYFPIPAEREPVPRLQILAGEVPIATWYQTPVTLPEITQNCVVHWHGWSGSPIAVEARDYAGNSTRVTTDQLLP